MATQKKVLPDEKSPLAPFVRQDFFRVNYSCLNQLLTDSPLIREEVVRPRPKLLHESQRQAAVGGQDVSARTSAGSERASRRR